MDERLVSRRDHILKQMHQLVGISDFLRVRTDHLHLRRSQRPLSNRHLWQGSALMQKPNRLGHIKSEEGGETLSVCAPGDGGSFQIIARNIGVSAQPKCVL